MCDVEEIPIDYVNTAMERLVKNDVHYRQGRCRVSLSGCMSPATPSSALPVRLGTASGRFAALGAPPCMEKPACNGPAHAQDTGPGVA